MKEGIYVLAKFRFIYYLRKVERYCPFEFISRGNVSISVSTGEIYYHPSKLFDLQCTQSCTKNDVLHHLNDKFNLCDKIPIRILNSAVELCKVRLQEVAKGI